MRRALALVALAVTSMVALAFLVPLGLMIREIAHEQAVSRAERQAVALAPVLATSTAPDVIADALESTRAGRDGRIAVHLPDGTLVGRAHAGAGALRNASEQARAFSVTVPGGRVLLQPIALDAGRVAVAEVYLPREALSRGVSRSWLTLGGVGVVLVAGSVLVADRLGTRVVGSARRLAGAASALGGGDLDVRVRPEGPSELAEAGRAFNTMAGRIRQLLAAEREMAADLSHRLRTPLTALRLNVEALGTDPVAEQTRQALDRLEREVDEVIVNARDSDGVAATAGTCDAAEVVAERLEFWSALAEDEERDCAVRGTDEPAPVPVPRTELVAAVDALIGNVFRHTPQGTGFSAAVHRGNGAVGVVVEDGGPGIEESDRALRRGSSAASSTGLGLDIVRRVAESTGGRVVIDRAVSGGARVRMWLWQEPTGSAPRRGRRRADSGGSKRRFGRRE